MRSRWGLGCGQTRVRPPHASFRSQASLRAHPALGYVCCPRIPLRYSHRVANGFDDSARAVKALEGVVGKRLTYRRTDERPKA